MNYLMDYPEGIKISAFGEIMLRLNPPHRDRLMQGEFFEASFGGSEFNVLGSLAIFGLNTSMVSQLPENDIGEACLRSIRSFGINSDHLSRADARMGQYFLEAGSNHRSGKIIYDRENSAFSQLKKTDLNWEEILADSHWFHLSGITPALTAELAEISLDAVRAAKAMGLTVSFDFNYRDHLWNNNNLDATKILGQIVQHVDVLMASERDCRMCLGIEVRDTSQDEMGRHYHLTEQIFKAFPNLQVMSSTFRDISSADHQNYSAGLRDRSGYYVSRNFTIRDITDRIGAGDAFAAGLIYGLMKNQGGQKALDFATAAGTIKHSIRGDVNLATREDIVGLLGDGFLGHIKR